MNNKKQLIVSIGLVLILVLMIVGISYAAFKFIGLGQKPNTITTGAITMEYTESTNKISMTGALPTTDATGKVRLTEGEYFDFTIKSNIQGNANINWEIAAEDVTTGTKKMDGKYIKLYLTSLDENNNETEVMKPTVYTTEKAENTYTGRPTNMMSLAKGTTSTSFSTKYRLRMYVDESYNPQGDGGGLSFSVIVNVYGKTGKKMPVGSKIKAYVTQADLNNEDFTRPQTDFHTYDYESKITSITTKKDNIVPETATESWDISEAGDDSVMAYVEDDGSGNSTYKVTIGGKGGIVANESMIYYFAGFYKMTSIDLSALDTSEVTNMSAMFDNCRNLTRLDVSKFDTSNVTDMGSMFSFCNGLRSLDVSSFDTSQVTNMDSMFSECFYLRSLDLSKFDTSKVTNMSGMFSGCSSLTSLDLSKFDTSNAIDMSHMFYGCGSLTSLDLSKFDTSNVIDMSSMFNSCTSLAGLDLRNFYTSNVIDMSAMFYSCSSLTSLDLRNFDTSKVTFMYSMFKECNKLTQITVSNKWVIKSGASTNEMFSNCGTDHVTVI